MRIKFWINKKINYENITKEVNDNIEKHNDCENKGIDIDFGLYSEGSWVNVVFYCDDCNYKEELFKTR